MLKRQGKYIIAATLLVLIFTQSAIHASIPKISGPERVEFVVKQGTSLTGIAHQLAGEGIIRLPYLFVGLSLFYKGKLIAGEYDLTRDMGMLEILKKMAHGERNIYTLKIVEGNNVYNLAGSIEKSRIMKGEDFLKLTKDGAFLKGLGIEADSLEGYLAPDTYYYSKEIDVDKLLEKIAQRTLSFFARKDIRKRMEEMRLTVHETLILASMIEREAKQRDEKFLISAVFHNRLKKGMSLDCDPTVLYGGAYDGPIRKSDLLTYTPYNTYAFKGLPKGPICNSDRSSITAALYPAAVDYLYFVSKNDGTHAFSRDMKDHNRFVAMYQRNKHTKK
ncbi:MAG: endolytic transglycosylase MltG [Syntrophobacterales bacterium]|jgi:UPF0755 protein|nr:endolytic transglycosylase MltG [Syntrophobacterales bacterium]